MTEEVGGKLRKRDLAKTINLWFLCAALLYIALLLLIFCDSLNSRRIAVVAIGGISIGAALGFLYSSFGDEKSVFSSVAVGINGLVGGVTLADLSNPNGVIRSCLVATAVACGLPENNAPLVAFILITSAAIGFGAIYLARHLI